ncbi:malonyl-ACP O-methyltransferase BioC [Halalkalibacter lacteus]|uniref:malonyl-ACP O-methyltransferase BioC n=1 Tax=Halalkalibacter lacteus TaxID=3090663 RepID=UPI002FC5B670
MINKSLLEKRFSKNSATYNDYANVQRIMAASLLSFTQPEPADPPTSILEIGSGTGLLTKQLADKYPDALIDAIDLAPGMIDSAKHYVQNKNVTFTCCDYEEVKLTRNYDLIVSNATFQWFNHLSDTIAKTCNHLNRGGQVLFSTFGPSTFYELNQSMQAAKLKISYEKRVEVSQRFLSLEDLLTICQGNSDETRCNVNGYEELHVEMFSEVRDFLKSINKIGASNSNTEHQSQSVSLFREMCTIYKERFLTEQGNIPATYHTLYIHILKE